MTTVILKELVQLCQTINENPTYQTIAYTCFILSWLVHHFLYRELEPYHHSQQNSGGEQDDDYEYDDYYYYLRQPDDNNLMGYTPDELKQYYNDLGPQGCKAYIRLCIWYLVPFIETVGLVTGMALVEQGRQQQQQQQQELAVLIPLLFILLGFIDKGVQMTGCWMFLQESTSKDDDQHEHKQLLLPDTIVHIASYSLIGQWMCVVAFLVTNISWGCRRSNGSRGHGDDDDDDEEEEETKQLAVKTSSSIGGGGEAKANLITISQA